MSPAARILCQALIRHAKGVLSACEQYLGEVQREDLLTSGTQPVLSPDRDSTAAQRLPVKKIGSVGGWREN